MSLEVEAAPDRVYGLVADVTRMGEYSPECYSCRWLDRATAPVVGARFRGANRFGLAWWARVCEVLAAEPGHEFAFRTVVAFPFLDSTTWRYRFEPSGGGTLVTESYEITKMPWYMRVGERLFGRSNILPAAMLETLRRIKAAAEA